MSRIHEMGRVVYWSAGALLVLNCVPHTLPGILKKRCALHSVNCTHCTPSLTAHYTLHTFTHCTHRTLVHYTQLSHTAHTVVSLKARLRQRNWWLMFTELQLPWYVQSPLTYCMQDWQQPFPLHTLPMCSHCPTLSASESSSLKVSVVSELLHHLPPSPRMLSSRLSPPPMQVGLLGPPYYQEELSLGYQGERGLEGRAARVHLRWSLQDYAGEKS